MIPTTVSSSPSTATVSSNSSGSSSGSATGNSNSNNNNSTSNNGQQNTSSIMIGLASLILEGRAIAEDEFHPQPLRSSSIPECNALSGSGYNSSSGGNSIGGAGGSSLSSALSSVAGRQSPTVRPSTSRAAATPGGRVINITTNPYAFCGGATCVAYDTAASPLYIDPYSSSSASSSAESNHQRWTQKLCQLRQASPAASLSSTYEQPVAVDGRHSNLGGDAELLTLAINESGTAERSEFEVVRRVMLNHANVSSAANTANSPGGATGSASSSPGSGSENFLFSLQSLATTCLRSGPSLESSGGGSYRYTTLSPPAVVRGPSYRATPPSVHRFPNAPGSGSSNGSGVQSPKSNWNSPLTTNIASPSGHLQTKEKFLRQAIATTSIASSSVYGARPSAPTVGAASWLHAHAAATTSATTKAAAAATTSSTYPQQGPHCDQFLRKMGLAKGEAAEAEEHFCDMTYVNITCSRWRAYCLKMEGIIGRGEPVCIEVYLGPVGHKILLEQWIITQKEKLPPPIMTLPSLCSAIRSQLYFSQISAWCDLIKKSDVTIYDTGRIIFPNPTGAAGDLATTAAAAAVAAATATSGANVTPGTSPTSSINQLANSVQNHRPRLNIFYRIKPYDSTACFNSKPNVHNFPNVNISENCSISVCLKSLPRINGGIPKVGATSTSAATTSTTTTTVAAGETVVAAAARTMATTAEMGTGVDVATNGNSNNNNSHSNGNGTSGQGSLSSNGARMNAYLDSHSNSNSIMLAETPRTSRSIRSTTQAAAADATSSVNCDMNKVHAFAENSSSPLTSKTSGLNRTFFNSPRTSSSTASSSSSTSVASGCVSVSNGCGGSGSSNSATSNSNIHAGSGKNKCMFFIDEEELLADEADGYDGSVAFDEDDNRSDTANSTGDSSTSAFSPCANMSHREKQLLKYRKRMLKRDKKHQRKPFSNASDASCEMGASEELQRRRQEQRNRIDDNGACQPMEQGEEESVVSVSVRNIAATVTATRSNQTNSSNNAHIEMISTGTQTPMMCCQQCGGEKTFVCLKCMRSDGARSPLAPTELDVDEMDDSASSISSSDIIHTPRNKAELLLQAIQRTPKAAKHKKQTLRATGSSGNAASSAMKLQNNNHLVLANGSIEPTVNGAAIGNGAVAVNGNAGCQVCKRQKTQHNFGERGDAEAAENAELEADVVDDEESGKVEESTYNVKTTNSLEQQQQQQEPQPVVLPTESQVMEEESFLSSTKLTPHISGCASNTSLPYQLAVTANCAAGDGNSARSCTPPNNTTHMDGDCCTENSKAEVQFKTPTTATNNNTGQQPQKQTITQRPQQQTPKPNLLQISCNYQSVGGAGDGFPMLRSDESLPKLTYVSSATTTPSSDQQPTQNQLPHNPLLLRKCLPKVNLTPIFCNPAATAVPTITSSHSSPIPIHGGMQDGTFSFDATTINRSSPRLITSGSNHHPLMHSSSATNTTTAAGATDNIPVQKSYSAPTLPNSPSLSPRFAKQAAIYKRRSRHLSDRSDRSSLGSDEQFSDEDLESGGIYSPATSPLKQRTRIAAAFGRPALLGNLEESLLQKRLMPKVEVMGFKVLLGASGGFCPTQLTIPAAAYFYELHGETLSTPYMCEIRLPRKGYSVPRVGTVQATLLNPMGTVVRMFVIPYDMHDMPALHQTFIRQRILAEASSNEATQNGANIQQVGVGQQLNTGSGGDGAAFANEFASDDAKSANSNKNNNDTKTNSNNNNNKYRLSPSGGLHSESNLGHFISAEHMKRLRYSIHLRFQTSRSGRLSLHTDIRLLISRRTDCDTAAAHAKGVLEAPNDLVTDTVMPSNPKYSARPEYSSSGSNKI